MDPPAYGAALRSASASFWADKCMSLSQQPAAAARQLTSPRYEKPKIRRQEVPTAVPRERVGAATHEGDRRRYCRYNLNAPGLEMPLMTVVLPLPVCPEPQVLPATQEQRAAIRQPAQDAWTVWCNHALLMLPHGCCSNTLHQTGAFC